MTFGRDGTLIASFDVLGGLTILERQGGTVAMFSNPASVEIRACLDCDWKTWEGAELDDDGRCWACAARVRNAKRGVK